MAGKNYLEMSDEDFMKLPELNDGVAEEAAPEVTSEAPEVTAEPEAPVVPEQTPEAPAVPETPEPEKPAEVPPAEKPEQTEEEKAAEAAALAANPDKPVEKPTEPEVPAEQKPDLQKFYEAVTQPIKANGKTIEIKSPEDAVRLMQMGAGFNRKMQDIQPHLKTLRFMEQNNLLNVDQSELAFLVDLRNKNPDAIKKLVKDAGIDPLDFNNEEEVKYQTNIPQVTDQQVVFREAIDNLMVEEAGRETVAIANTWDAQSHQVLMDTPELLNVIHEQRQLGIYDRIVAEMDRQKALNRIPASTPFLAAYKQVGDHLRDINGFADLIQKQDRSANEQVAPTPPPQIVDKRVAAPKPSVTNNDKANAAAATRTTPKTAAPLVNPLAMSDEDFAKQYGNRF